MHPASRSHTSRPLALGSALALLLGGVLWLLAGAGDGDAAPVGAAPPAAAGTGDAPATGRRADETAAPRTSALPDAAHERRVRGRLVGAYGDELAGALVGEAGSETPARTGADGAFDCTFAAAAGDAVLLTIAAGHAPLATVVPFPAAAREQDLGELQLRLGGTLRGRVVEGAQQPVADVTVTAQAVAIAGWPSAVVFDELVPTLRTGASGEFVFAHLPPGGYRVVATGDGWQTTRSPTASVVDAATTTLDPLVLAAGYSLTGRVLGPDDGPLAGARVRARAAAGQPRVDVRAESAADGTFTLEALPPGALRLDVQRDGYLSAVADGVDARRDEVVVVRLDAGLVIRGHVVDATTRAPVERFALVVERTGSLDDVTPGAFDAQLQRQADTLRQEAAAATDDAARAERAAIAEQLDARVVAWRDAQRQRPTALPDDDAPLRTWPDGRFVAEGLDEGAYTVGIATPEHAFARLANVELRRGAAAPHLTFELQRGLRVTGTVVGAPDGATVAGAQLELHRVDERTAPPPPTQRALFPWLFAAEAPRRGVVVARTRSGADGAFVFASLPAGAYFVAVRHDACADHDTGVVVLRADLALRIAAPRRAALHGTVTGAPAGARAEVLVLGGHGVQRTTPMHADGTYRFDGLQPGEYYVRAFPGDNAQYVNRFFGALFPEHAGAIDLAAIPARDVVLTAGEVRTFAVPFDRPATGVVTGQATWNGRPGTRARVVLRPVVGSAPGAGGLALSANADDAGAFVVRDVPVGDYDLALHGPTRQELSVRRVMVRAAETTRVEASAEAGAVRGRITATDGTPASELRGYVWILPGAAIEPADLYEYRRGHRVHRLAVRDGVFEDTFSTPGPALVVTDLRGRRRTATAVHVPANGTAELSLTAGARTTP